MTRRPTHPRTDLPLTVSEAAPTLSRLLGREVSRSLLYEWVKAGKVPSTRDAQGRARLSLADLRAYARAHREPAAPTEWRQGRLSTVSEK